MLLEVNKRITHELMKQADCAPPSPNKALRQPIARGTLIREVWVQRHAHAVVWSGTAFVRLNSAVTYRPGLHLGLAP